MSPRYDILKTNSDGTQVARDTHLNREVMLKPYCRVSDQIHLQGLIEKLSSAQSKHVADVYDVHVRGDRLAVVEEFLNEEKSLNKWNPADAKVEHEVLLVLFQMASALEKLQAVGLAPSSLDADAWRFDDEGILNLSIFDPGREDLIEIRATQASSVDFEQFGEPIAQKHLDPQSKLIRDLRDLWRETSVLSATHQRLHSWLLRDKHRAVLVNRTKTQTAELNSSRRRLKLAHPNPTVAEAIIMYSGTEFQITACTGEFYVNNMPISLPHTIPGSCVMTLGGPSRPWSERHFVTFDLSHPEVIF